ncbi:MAG: hypothetical protein IID33_08510 [Planctomycetes bacterium]|nr:hypothetical protein [Planctomycetota bacterium]
MALVALLFAVPRVVFSDGFQNIAKAIVAFVCGVAGLWTGQGALRRGRNIASIYLCDDHVTRDKQLDRSRLIAKILFITVSVGIIVWLPMPVMSFIMPGGDNFPLRVILGAVGPVAFIVTLALLNFFNARLSRYRGISLRFRQGKLQITCRNHEYAKCISTPGSASFLS